MLFQVLRICSDLVVAAADTTSLTALWALHLAAREGEEEQKKVFYCPNMAIDRNSFKSVSLQILNSDRYVSWFLKETMRLYPVATFITR